MRDDVRVFVLDYLRDGSADLDEMCRAALHLGFTREQVLDALEGFGVGGLTNVSDGRMTVFRSSKLHAIWWARRAPAHRFTGAARGGSAA